jgi:DNA gyrase subunit A
MDETPTPTPDGEAPLQPPLHEDSANVRTVDIEDEVQRSYLDYAMSVIVGRALPDVRDGLKPVHRRILWGMLGLGLRPGTPYKKSARVTGDVMGKYHPHGDSAIYDALARMAQPFAMRHPLIDGHGNFGSVDGDPPAAARYTEVRLASLAMELLRDINEDTVDIVPNYDGEENEPSVLPARFPNLLVNGSTGIAVGMATNIPPHNLGEVIDATVHLMDEPDTSSAELNEIIKGPDFPGGGVILGRAGIRDAYETGRGIVRVRAKTEIEETKRGTRIVVTELPYMVSGDRLIEKIAELVNAKKIAGVSGGRNESNRKGTRIVIELKRDAIPQVVLNNLYKFTQMQDSFGMNMLALVDGVPRTLALRDIIRRTRFRLKKAQDRMHILEGLLIALDHLDEVITLIREAPSADEARGQLMSRFELTEIQATAILDMMLRRLAGLERDKIRQEAAELAKTIEELQALLESRALQNKTIRNDLLAIKEKFANPRRTEIAMDEGEFNIEDLIADEDVVITITRTGYIKRVKSATYKTQGRGGKGVIGAKPKEGDLVQHMLTTSNHAFVMIFSNRGKVYRLKAHEIPEKERTSIGTHIKNLLPYGPDETTAAIIDTRDYETHAYLVIATHKGIVKKTAFNAYNSSRKDGIIAINLRDDDSVDTVRATSGKDDLIMVSRKGMSIRFNEEDVRPMGRTAGGVIGMKMGEDDNVVSFDVVTQTGELLIITNAGYGKRTLLDKYPRQRRGGRGVKTAKLIGRRGLIQGAMVVNAEDEIFLIASDGQVIRMTVKGISRQGRDTTGVRVMTMDKGVEVVAIAPVNEEAEPAS